MRLLRPHRAPGWCFIACTALLTSAASAVHAQPATSSSDGNYIDSAIPLNRFRLRFDAAYNNNRPDRAEFFYSQYQPQVINAAPGSILYVNTPPSGQAATTGGGGQGGGPGPSRGQNGELLVFSQPNQIIGNPAARGLPRPETRIDYQDISAMLELAANDRLSGFLEVPVRFLNPELNNNTAGLADINAGFKWAFISDPDLVTSFQMRVYIPTGASTHGLGTNHVSLEPALLVSQQLTEGLTFIGEFRDWIPIGGTDFEGNVIRYGVGLNYRAYDDGGLRISPIVELVGWTVLGGKETAAITPTLFEIQGASGDTIVNAKMGVRFSFGEQNDFSVSYGRALTGDVWYKDILRVEYRLSF